MTRLSAAFGRLFDALAVAAREFPDALAAIKREGVRTALAVPLLKGKTALGAILIRRVEVRPFTKRQIALLKTFAALEPAAQAALARDLKALVAQFNRSGDGSMVVPSEYLEIVITRA